MTGTNARPTDGNESDHSSSYLNSPITGHPVTPSIATQAVATAHPGRRGRRPAASKPFSQWTYWCGPHYVPQPAMVKGEFLSEYAEREWEDPYALAEAEYGDEMRMAARLGEGVKDKVAVYSREMPEEMRRALEAA